MANGLVSANQFQLVPEISRLGSGAAQGFQLGRQFKQGQREQAQFEQQQQAGQLAGQFLGGQKEAGQQLAAVDPQRAQAIQSFLTSQSEAERAEDLRENQVLTQTALSAQSLPPEQRRAFLQQERERFRADKRDTSNIDRALAGDDAALNQAIELQARQGLEIQQQAERLFPETTRAQPFQKGPEGTVFDPNTGKSIVDPVVARRLENKAQRAVEKGKELDFKDRQGLNKDVTSLLKSTVEINNTAKDLSKLGEIKSGPASIAIVFKFMKALDPTSVVREGEFATAENSAGIPESVSNIYNKLVSGQRLGDPQINQFIETSRSLSNAAVSSSQEQLDTFLDTFGDTIPDDFKSKLKDRVPSLIESPGEDLTTLSDEELQRQIQELKGVQ